MGRFGAAFVPLSCNSLRVILLWQGPFPSLSYNVPDTFDKGDLIFLNPNPKYDKDKRMNNF